MVPVVVIIGAGASYASGQYEVAQRPPLTRGLFESTKARALLRTYVLANNASRAVRRLMQADDTVAFEQALRSLREDGHPHRQQMSLALPPYLQALMLAYSEELHADAERYSVLIDELLKLRTRILFVSLNYDTLLDSNLGAFSPLQSIDDYVSETRQWDLVKPHGSANWYVELDDFFDPTAPPADLRVPEGPIECVPAKSFPLHIARGAPEARDPHTLSRRYPAIALPEGPKDKLVMPPHHYDHFMQALEASHEIDLLVLGYSALDTEVLDLIARSGSRIRRMTVVNRDAESTLEVYRRIEDHGISATWPDTFDSGFTHWIDGAGPSRVGPGVRGHQSWAVPIADQPRGSRKAHRLTRDGATPAGRSHHPVAPTVVKRATPARGLPHPLPHSRPHRPPERQKPRSHGASIHSGGGIRTRDLRVMSPTSYQTAPPRGVDGSL